MFRWGAGSLAQDDWSVVQRFLPRLAVLGVAAALLLRPLRLLGLSAETTTSLGVSLALFRTLTLGVAVCLVATVTAAVGKIGFVEIAAPLLVRLAGARTFGLRLVLASVIGAGLLVIVDTLVQAIDDRTGAFLPTGAATALLGAPLLLGLLPRLRANVTLVARLDIGRRVSGCHRSVLVALVSAVLTALLLSLAVGREGAGWTMIESATWATILPWRMWRVVEAFAGGGGALVGAAGALLQRVTGNPMASPEILGLGAAVMAGLTIALIVEPAPSLCFLLAMGSPPRSYWSASCFGAKWSRGLHPTN